jgi:hypothetical protein
MHVASHVFMFRNKFEKLVIIIMDNSVELLFFVLRIINVIIHGIQTAGQLCTLIVLCQLLPNLRPKMQCCQF